MLRSQNAFYTNQKRICIEVGIELPKHKPNIEKYILETHQTSQLLKFWIYDLIDHFDFNSYSHYYFTLKLQERKIFNKKAKAIMGGEIKASMLKKREPWKFLERFYLNENPHEKYTATWKSIWFGDGFIKICIEQGAVFSPPFNWSFSEEKFNLLYEYISGRRLNKLIIVVEKGHIKSIKGLEDLEETIWKVLIIKETESSAGTTIKSISQNKIPVNMILRNKCIQFLNQLQLKGLRPTLILEKTVNITKGGIGVDVSLLYSIPLNKEEIAVIWESLELEKHKGTHIFKCSKAEYEKVFFEIENFLSKNIKVRSKLYSKEIDDLKNQKKLRYLCRIDHDDFYQWKSNLFDIFPELKND